VEDNLAALNSEARDFKGMLKGVIIRKQNLEVRLKTWNTTSKPKDDVVDFKMMGIDHLFVDETKFKNLMFNTRHDRVAGLEQYDGSQKP
jgi:N12 class adenine-specific DNA methylase